MLKKNSRIRKTLEVLFNNVFNQIEGQYIFKHFLTYTEMFILFNTEIPDLQGETKYIYLLYFPVI